MELKFIRDSQKREIDFVIIRNGKPEFAVECKSGERNLSRDIKYFSERTSIPIFYQVHMGQTDQEHATARARILPFSAFSKILGI